jgi:hypothetical protein
MIDRKTSSLSVVAIAVAALLLTIGSGVALAQVVASATGSGQIHVNGEYRTFTFSAQTDNNNVTTGVTQGFNRSLPFSWQGSINCLDVEGNIATMSGNVTYANPDPGPGGITIGTPLVFQVIDNGEGHNSPPDLISLTFFNPGGPPFPCLQSVDGIFANIPIEHGNVQVHKH